METKPASLSRRTSLQRKVVHKIIEAAHDHPTAQIVFDRARKQVPSISLGTVYRNLQLLAGQGLVVERKIGNRPTRYEAQRKRHYHISCVQCGAIEDLSVPYQQVLDRRVQRMVRYRLQEHRMEFLGVCPQCQAAPLRARPVSVARMARPG